MYKNLEKEQAKAFLSDRDVAVLLGITESELRSCKESGIFSPAAQKRLCQIFKCRSEYLFQSDR